MSVCLAHCLSLLCSAFRAEDVEKEKMFREYKDDRRIFHFLVDNKADEGKHAH